MDKKHENREVEKYIVEQQSAHLASSVTNAMGARSCDHCHLCYRRPSGTALQQLLVGGHVVAFVGAPDGGGKT